MGFLSSRDLAASRESAEPDWQEVQRAVSHQHLHPPSADAAAAALPAGVCLGESWLGLGMELGLEIALPGTLTTVFPPRGSCSSLMESRWRWWWHTRWTQGTCSCSSTRTPRSTCCAASTSRCSPATLSLRFPPCPLQWKASHGCSHCSFEKVLGSCANLLSLSQEVPSG